MFDQYPNPPKRETKPGSRSSLFTGASIIISFTFIAYGFFTLLVGKTNGWSMALALSTVIYGFYSLAVTAYAYKRGVREAVLAIQFGAALFLIVFIFIFTMTPQISSGLAGAILACIGIWCNWIAVVKIVKRQMTVTVES